MSRRLATERMIGVIRTTVVTLSMKAETTAVTTERISSSRIGWPCDSITDRIASQSKKPGPGQHRRDHHHPDEQEDDVEVDGGERLLLVDDPEDDDEQAPGHRDQRPVPPVDRDQGVDDHEHGRRDPGIHRHARAHPPNHARRGTSCGRDGPLGRAGRPRVNSQHSDRHGARSAVDARGATRMSADGRAPPAAARGRVRAIPHIRMPDGLAGRAAARHDPQTPEEPPWTSSAIPSCATGSRSS